MNLLRRIELYRLWRREYARVHAELGSFSQRELQSDLFLNRSDIPDVAAQAATSIWPPMCGPIRSTWRHPTGARPCPAPARPRHARLLVGSVPVRTSAMGGGWWS